MLPLNGMSARTGVSVESQSCVSCGDVWKYHSIFPVSTFTAISAHGIQVVALSASHGIGRRRIAGAENIQLRLGIVGAGNPGHPAAVARRIQAGPGVESGIAGVLRAE